MSTVFRPAKVVFEWKDCEIIVRSQKATQDYKEFEKVCDEVNHLIKAALDMEKK
jgi:hypothetical protein